MSADILQSLAPHLTVDMLGDLWGISPHSCYPYMCDREMRYSQLRTLMRHAKDDRVISTFLRDLLPGTGWIATKMHIDLDINGDGVLDCDDALAAALDGIASATEAACCAHAATIDQFITGKEADDIIASCEQVISHAMQCREVAAEMRRIAGDRQPARRPAVAGLSKSRGGGA